MTIGLMHLRALAMIAEEGNISAAARKMHMTQPAVSRLLRQLEDHLGDRLANRSTHTFRLTAAGEQALIRATRALKSVEVALTPIGAGDHLLRLGYAWGALGSMTSALLRAWSAEHPRSPVQLERIDEHAAGLLRGVVDAAIVRDLESGPGVGRRFLRTEERIAVLPSGHRLAARSSVALADLGDDTLVINRNGGTTSQSLWGHRSHNARTLEVENTDDWLSAIATGRGCGVSTSVTAELHPNSGLEFRELIDAPPSRVELIWIDPPTPEVAALTEYLERILVKD